MAVRTERHMTVYSPWTVSVLIPISYVWIPCSIMIPRNFLLATRASKWIRSEMKLWFGNFLNTLPWVYLQLRKVRRSVERKRKKNTKMWFRVYFLFDILSRIAWPSVGGIDRKFYDVKSGRKMRNLDESAWLFFITRKRNCYVVLLPKNETRILTHFTAETKE